MPRFATGQPDLFTPLPEPEPPRHDPLGELVAMLERLRAAESLPWPTLSAAMQAEYRVLWLARQAGPEGQRLASAITDEMERVLARTD